MNLEKVFLLSSLVALLAAMPTCVRCDTHLGPDIPALGDVSTANKFVKAGDIAAAAGNIQEAISDYQQASALSLFLEDAALGLARCATTQGKFDVAIKYYRAAIYGHQEDYSIDLLTEYILVLNQAGQGPEAISLYNHVVDLCKKGYCIHTMEIMPQKFRLNGSDYDPAKLQSMTHLMRAMNSSCSDNKRTSSEIQKALALTPKSSIVYFYQGVLLSPKNPIGANEAFQKALSLDDGSNAKLINKWVADTM